MRFLTAVLIGWITATQALAAPNLIVDGNFAQESVGGSASTLSAQLNGYQGYGSGATLAGWSNAAYAFVFTPGTGTSGTTADTTGATINQYGGAGSNPNVYLWGPGSGGGGVANGLTESPAGGNFVAIDGAVGTGTLNQTVSGLTVGFQYQLSFTWAAAEQGGFSGTTTQGFTVGWSDGTRTTSFSTPSITLAAHAFSPWQTATTTFIATSTTETLSFLATGGPSGSPPMSLLDTVSLSAVPEPAGWWAMAGGLAGVALCRAFRRRPD